MLQFNARNVSELTLAQCQLSFNTVSLSLSLCMYIHLLLVVCVVKHNNNNNNNNNKSMTLYISVYTRKVFTFIAKFSQDKYILQVSVLMVT